MEYPIIDAHQHFWNFDPGRDGWITDEMKDLQRDWLPGDYGKYFQGKSCCRIRSCPG